MHDNQFGSRCALGDDFLKYSEADEITPRPSMHKKTVHERGLSMDVRQYPVRKSDQLELPSGIHSW